MNINTEALANAIIDFGKELKRISEDKQLKVLNYSLPEEEKKFLTKADVLKKFNCFNESSLYRAYRYDGLPTYKQGRHRFYKEEDVSKWLEQHKETNSSMKSLVRF